MCRLCGCAPARARVVSVSLLYHHSLQTPGIHWRSVQWTELRKPFYSALAFRLAMLTFDLTCVCVCLCWAVGVLVLVFVLCACRRVCVVCGCSVGTHTSQLLQRRRKLTGNLLDYELPTRSAHTDTHTHTHTHTHSALTPGPRMRTRDTPEHTPPHPHAQLTVYAQPPPPHTGGTPHHTTDTLCIGQLP